MKNFSFGYLLSFLILAVQAIHATECYADEYTSFHLAEGRIKISVPKSWNKVGQNSSSRAEVLAFQIHDKADEGTPHSTNVAITVQKIPSGTSLQVFGDAVIAHHTKRPEVVLVSDSGSKSHKRLVMARGEQHDTPYILTSVIGVSEEFGIDIFLSYPILKGTTDDWTKKLLKDFNALPENVLLDKKAFFK